MVVLNSQRSLNEPRLDERAVELVRQVAGTQEVEDEAFDLIEVGVEGVTAVGIPQPGRGTGSTGSLNRVKYVSISLALPRTTFNMPATCCKRRSTSYPGMARV